MGFPPPPDEPPPGISDVADIDAGFALGPPAATICGFTIPTLKFSLKFFLKLPLPFKLPFPPFLHLQFSCDPLGFSAEVTVPGGGRVGTMPADPDA